MKKFRYIINTQEFDDNNTDSTLYEYFDNNHISYENRGEMSLKELYMVSKINSLGENGWELVSVIDKKNKTTFYFKKEINEKENPKMS